MLNLQNDTKTKDFLKAKTSLEEKSKESNLNKAKIQEIIDKAEPLTVIPLMLLTPFSYLYLYIHIHR